MPRFLRSHFGVIAAVVLVPFLFLTVSAQTTGTDVESG